jgi:hypothetical protein
VRVAVLVPLIDATLPPALAFLMLAPGAGSTGQAFEKAATFPRRVFPQNLVRPGTRRIVPVGHRLCQIRYYRDPLNLAGQIIAPAEHWLGSALQGHGT